MRGIYIAFLLASAAVPAQAQTSGDAEGSTTPSGVETPTPTPGSTVTATTGTDWADLKKQADAMKAAYDSMAAASTAQKSAIDAQASVTAAKIGTVTGQTEIKGVMTMGNYVAKGETLLLVTRSAQMASTEIAGKLKPSLKDARYAGRTVLILMGTNELATSDAIQFDIQLRSITQMLAAARASYATAKVGDVKAQEGTGQTRVVPFAAAGAAIEAITKLGSYFQVDRTFGAVELDPAPGLMANAMIEALRNTPTPAANPLVIPANFVASDVAVLTSVLDPIQIEYMVVVGEEAAAKQRAADLAKSSDIKASPAAARFVAADAAASKAMSAYEALIGALIQAPQDGKDPFGVRVIRQKKIQTALAANPLILLLGVRQAAAYYSMRSLWTFLGGPPIKAMGGVSLTYSLYESDTGNVLYAGAVGKHGGYRSIRSIEKMFR